MFSRTRLLLVGSALACFSAVASAQAPTPNLTRTYNGLQARKISHFIYRNGAKAQPTTKGTIYTLTSFDAVKYTCTVSKPEVSTCVVELLPAK